MSLVQKSWDDFGPFLHILNQFHSIEDLPILIHIWYCAKPLISQSYISLHVPNNLICHAFKISTIVALIDSLLWSSAFCKAELESIQSAVRLSNDTFFLMLLACSMLSYSFAWCYCEWLIEFVSNTDLVPRKTDVAHFAFCCLALHFHYNDIM